LGEPSEFVEPVPDAEGSIGWFLTEFDASLRAWSRLKLTARTQRELRTMRLLERDMGQRSRKRFEELSAQLESGAEKNRAVAAVALGFSDDPRALSPLMRALSDPSNEVVGNALLGLGVLGHDDTPLAQICHLLRDSNDPWTRNNAAFALQGVVTNGARGEDVFRACREALSDQEPGVRTQAATVLGILADSEAIPPLGDLLYDDVRLVSAAASTSLGRLGLTNPHDKGKVARLLVDALDRVKPSKRERIRYDLEQLAGANLGDRIDEWREWAYRLP
jgi:HEAT repeat protein